MSTTSDYVAIAIGAMKGRAKVDDLIVDSSASHALQLILTDALAKAQLSEGALAFSERGEEFGQTASLLADEAAKEAMKSGAGVVGSAHVQAAAAQARVWNIWPFKGD